MNFIEILTLIFITQISSFLMLILGMNINSKSTPKAGPIEAIKEKKKQKENRKEFELAEKQRKIMIENINNYDGTSFGQKDIPME